MLTEVTGAITPTSPGPATPDFPSPNFPLPHHRGKDVCFDCVLTLNCRSVRIPLSGSSSRIPTLTPSPSKTVASHLKSSMESLDDLEWDTEVSPRHRRSLTPGDETRSKPPGSLSSSSSYSNSPQKRTRDEPLNKSPYNEISPSKTRRGSRGSSPSKIPIAGSYIPLRTSSEDLLRDQSGLDRLPQDSDEEEEELGGGGGEGMAESVLGEEFLRSQREVSRSPTKSRIPTSASGRSVSYISGENICISTVN